MDSTDSMLVISDPQPKKKLILLSFLQTVGLKSGEFSRSWPSTVQPATEYEGWI